MPESVAVISLSRQLQLCHAESSTLETAGIYLAAPENFLGRSGERGGKEGAAMEQVLTNLLCTNPHAFSIFTQRAMTLFPAPQQGFNSRDVAALTFLFSAWSVAVVAGRQVSVTTPINR